MKIYIVGPVASGKSTIAKKISEITKMPFYSLDEIVYIPNLSRSLGNRKREVGERDELFQSIIKQSNWIIEDVGRPCFEEGLKEADIIILLEVCAKVRNYRIVKRWVKQRLGFEQCSYDPNLEMLKNMFKWSKSYDVVENKLKKRISIYPEKVVILKERKEVKSFLKIFDNLSSFPIALHSTIS